MGIPTPGTDIPSIRIRWEYDNHIFIMEIPISVQNWSVSRSETNKFLRGPTTFSQFSYHFMFKLVLKPLEDWQLLSVNTDPYTWNGSLYIEMVLCYQNHRPKKTITAYHIYISSPNHGGCPEPWLRLRGILWQPGVKQGPLLNQHFSGLTIQNKTSPMLIFKEDW